MVRKMASVVPRNSTTNMAKPSRPVPAAARSPSPVSKSSSPPKIAVAPAVYTAANETVRTSTTRNTRRRTLSWIA